MTRQLRGLSSKVFDVLVVGGGIHGAAIAREAAHRGLDVALVDRDDIGARTSANSLKIVHGGLRYLQSADLKRTRESIRERTTLLRIAPHLVRPLPCILPLYRGGGVKNPLFMSVALKTADLVGFDRNNGIESDRSLDPGHVVDAQEAAHLAPGIRRDGLVGGAVWTDAQMTNSARLVLSFALAAHRAGASVLNYTEVRQLIRAGRRVIGASVRDSLTGQEFNLWARCTVNAAGPWVEDVARLAETSGHESAPGLTAAMNVVIRRPLTASHAIGASRPGGPVLFIVPWRGATLVGTRHWGFRGTPNSFRVGSDDVTTVLKELNAALPGAGVIEADVVGVLSGLLPGEANPETGEVELLKRQRLVHHERRDGVPGLISVVGIKFTTARYVAEQATDLVFRSLKRQGGSSNTSWIPIHGGKTGPLSVYIQSQSARHQGRFSASLIQRLIETYGSEYERVLGCMRSGGDEPVHTSTPVIRAEIVHAVRQELACRLADVVLRRTEMFVVTPPVEAAIAAAADVMGEVSGWDASRRRREIDDTLEEISVHHGVPGIRLPAAEAV